MQGKRPSPDDWEARRDEFLPSDRDKAYVRNLMVGVLGIGEIANWIAKPTHGIRGLPFEFEYVRREP